MASIKTIKGKKCTTYRVEAMIDGVRLPSKSFKKKNDAELYAAQLTVIADAKRGCNFRVLHSFLLSDLIDAYLRQYNGKDTSRKQRLSHWQAELGHLPLDNVTRRRVRDVLRNLCESGVSNATHNRYKSALSAVFKYAEEEYEIDHNPCVGIKNRPEGQPIDRWADADEISRLLEACKKSKWPRLYLFVLIALHTGMRRGSCLSLRWSAINFDDKLAYLPTSKNAKPILIPLNDEVIAELAKIREVGNGYIFHHPSSKQESFRNLDSHWRTAKKRAGITEPLRIHDLRHTTGSWLGQAGVPMTEIRDIMTHKSIQTTQRYVHHHYKDKAQKLQEVFGGVS